MYCTRIHVPLAATMAERGVDLSVTLVICSKMADGQLLFLTLLEAHLQRIFHQMQCTGNGATGVLGMNTCTA